MAAVSFVSERPCNPERVVVLRERRITSSEHCPTCDSRRKTWVSALGWVCTLCFERCKAEAEQLVEVGHGAARMRQAYELAIHAYREVL
jgi:ribosomal protein L37AE/L43A